MHGNINFVWNKIKDKEKFPLVFQKQLYLHGIFPSIDSCAFLRILGNPSSYMTLHPFPCI
jgi:hypothetical protein